MAHLGSPGQRHNRAVPSGGRYISLAGAALPCRGCVPSHGDIAVTIVPFVRLWPDPEAPTAGPAGPLIEVDLPR
jgi:hypothetical protein